MRRSCRQLWRPLGSLRVRRRHRFGDRFAGTEGVKACGRTLDVLGDHSITCKVGGGPVRLHHCVARVLGSLAKEAGLLPEHEVAVPELLRGEPGHVDGSG